MTVVIAAEPVGLIAALAFFGAAAILTGGLSSGAKKQWRNRRQRKQWSDS